MATFNFTAKLKLDNDLKKSLDTEESIVEVEIQCDYLEISDAPFLDMETDDEILIEDVVVVYDDDDIVELIDESALRSIILKKYREGDWMEDSHE